MSPLIQLGSAQLLPVKDAAEFVPYSRDYVARLAREGKVVATQIDRQWFVDVVSLQNFFNHATIEESVRKRHLSVIRKRDLEVRDVYRSRLAVITTERTAAHRSTIAQTGLVMLCGACAGFLFISAQQVQPHSILSFVNSVTHMESSDATVVRSVIDENKNVLPGVQNAVIETDESFPVTEGIVLLPNGSASSSTVEDFFSDPVTVEMTSTTSGSIRNTVSNKAVPFVRVPSGSMVVSGASDSNAVAP